MENTLPPDLPEEAAVRKAQALFEEKDVQGDMVLAPYGVEVFAL